MDNIEFKRKFGDIAKEEGFDRAFEGWFKESNETIIVLELQKSNFSNCYYLNFKIYVQGMFGNSYVRNKDLVKKDVGDIFTRQPMEYGELFNLNNGMKNDERIEGLKDLFDTFIIPLTNKALSKSGIKQLAEKGKLFLLPAVKEELYR